MNIEEITNGILKFSDSDLETILQTIENIIKKRKQDKLIAKLTNELKDIIVDFEKVFIDFIQDDDDKKSVKVGIKVKNQELVYFTIDSGIIWGWAGLVGD